MITCCTQECDQGRKCPLVLRDKWRLKVGRDAMILIQRYSDPSMWYAQLVGTQVLVERVDYDGLWAREPAGYINIIRFEDVE